MVVVAGEALIDVIHHPNGIEQTRPGGGPFNTARALARLGVETAFLGHLSSDEHGRELARRLVEDGVMTDLVTVGPEPTTVARAYIDGTGSARFEFASAGTSAPELTMDMLPAKLGSSAGALHVGTLGLLLEPMATTLSSLVERERGRRLIMVDPNVRLGLATEVGYRERLLNVIGASTVVKASDSDVAWLYPGASYREAAESMLDAGPRAIFVTLGEDGAFGAYGDLRIHVRAPRVDVVDTIGAGDSFGAGVLAWLHDNGLIDPELELDGAQLQSALEYACKVASLTCARAGADPPSKQEMAQA
jgi:fructokinase